MLVSPLDRSQSTGDCELRLMESQLTPPADENFANTNQLFTSIHTDIFGQDCCGNKNKHVLRVLVIMMGPENQILLSYMTNNYWNTASEFWQRVPLSRLPVSWTLTRSFCSDTLTDHFKTFPSSSLRLHQWDVWSSVPDKNVWPLFLFWNQPEYEDCFNA